MLKILRKYFYPICKDRRFIKCLKVETQARRKSLIIKLDLFIKSYYTLYVFNTTTTR